jgi:hypothetical protein
MGWGCSDGDKGIGIGTRQRAEAVGERSSGLGAFGAGGLRCSCFLQVFPARLRTRATAAPQPGVQRSLMLPPDGRSGDDSGRSRRPGTRTNHPASTERHLALRIFPRASACVRFRLHSHSRSPRGWDAAVAGLAAAAADRRSTTSGQGPRSCSMSASVITRRGLYRQLPTRRRPTCLPNAWWIAISLHRSPSPHPRRRAAPLHVPPLSAAGGSVD